MLADYLVQAFRGRVSEMDWLSDLSKQRTIDKVDAIISMVAYPDQIMDNDYVNGLYVTVSKETIPVRESKHVIKNAIALFSTQLMQTTTLAIN